MKLYFCVIIFFVVYISHY